MGAWSLLDLCAQGLGVGHCVAYHALKAEENFGIHNITLVSIFVSSYVGKIDP